MAGRRRSGERERGYMRKRGNSYQVLVYSGVDPVTGQDSYLSESTRDEKKVGEIRSRMLAKVDRQRTAATKATLNYALEAWLEVHEADESTLDRYRELATRTIGGRSETLPSPESAPANSSSSTLSCGVAAIDVTESSTSSIESSAITSAARSSIGGHRAGRRGEPSRV